MTWDKVLLIGVIAVLVIGPERLPRYAEKLAQFVRQARDYLRTAQDRVKDEMGSDFDDLDWKKLDPRQYDPRRIVREALLDDPAPARVSAAAGAAVQLRRRPRARLVLSPALVHVFEEPPPFDDEAT